jgi:hypothetical protein
MKILKFLIIFISITLYFSKVSAQIYPQYQKDDFFMPAYETAPKREKLPPLPKQPIQQVYNHNSTLYDIQYKFVNGVYVPVYTKKIIEKKQPQVVNYDADEHPMIKKTVHSAPKTEQIIEEPQLQNIDDAISIIADSVSTIMKNSPTLTNTTETPKNETYQENSITEYPNYKLTTEDEYGPPYRKIYNQYIKDTIEFNKTGTFPYNENLEQSLKKMSSGKQITVFRGPVKPILTK